MKAVVFHGVGDIRLEDVAEPQLKDPMDAIVRLTASSICGTDLHMVRGTVTGMEPGTILGHEGVGVVEKLGTEVRNLNLDDRVVVPSTSTVACGYCAYCRAGYYSQRDNANPNGKHGGTVFYGGPKTAGALLRSGQRGHQPGRYGSGVRVRARGPVRDHERQGLRRRPHAGQAAQKLKDLIQKFSREVKEIAPEQHPQGADWFPGDAPSLTLQWAVMPLAKAGTLSIIGVYPETANFFPIGSAMMKNLSVTMGNCNHRKYIPILMDMVESGVVDPTDVLTQKESFASVIDACKTFDQRTEGWVKVELKAM